MRVDVSDPPRLFEVGRERRLQMKDCGRIWLEADEQVTFVTASGAEYDVARKSWGFYATPSLNRRLVRFGLRAVLAKSPNGSFFVFLVERGKEAEFGEYVGTEQLIVVCWLDNDRDLEALEWATRR